MLQHVEWRHESSGTTIPINLRFTEIKKYFPQLTAMFVPCTKINTQSCYPEVQGMEDSLLGFSGKHWKVSGKKKK